MIVVKYVQVVRLHFNITMGNEMSSEVFFLKRKRNKNQRHFNYFFFFPSCFFFIFLALSADCADFLKSVFFISSANVGKNILIFFLTFLFTLFHWLYFLSILFFFTTFKNEIPENETN